MALSLEIVTPDGIAWHSADVDSVSLPTTSGEIEVLPGHVPLITMLEAGAVVVGKASGAENIAIDKGYARILGDVVSVLTEAAIDVERLDERDIDRAREDALKSLEEAKKNKISDDEIERLEAIARFTIAQTLAKGAGKKH